MTLVDKHGRRITTDELAADYAQDLRNYSSLTAEEIEQRVAERYQRVAALREQQATQEER